MAKTTSTVKIGIFIFLGLVILTVAIFMIGDKNQIFSSSFTVKAYFKDIQGLKEGASVRMSGINVGSVTDIEIADDNTGRVVVVMSLNEEVRRFVRIDTKASIETEGLVGNKVVILKITNQNTPYVKENGFIQAEEGGGFAAIIAETQKIMENTKKMTGDLAEITGRINKGEGTIGLLLNDDELYNSLKGLTVGADSSLANITREFSDVTVIFDRLGEGVATVVDNINTVVGNIDTVVSNVKNGHGVIGSLLSKGSNFDTSLTRIIANFEKTSDDARISASRLAENMEALKHNWLFKSYFEKRGYWNEAEFDANIDEKLIQLDEKIKLLDDKIKTLKSLETTRN